MPELNGLEATRQIMAAQPAARVLILTAHSDDVYRERAIEVGAAGFVRKQASAETVLRAIHTVLARSPDPMRQPRRGITHLTPREREVLQLIAEGRGNKEAARRLDISCKTVEKHREHLMAKLNLHDTAGLTRYAIGSGIIEGAAPPATG